MNKLITMFSIMLYVVLFVKKQLAFPKRKEVVTDSYHVWFDENGKIKLVKDRITGKWCIHALAEIELFPFYC